MRISQAQPLSPSPPETAHQNPFSSPRSYQSTLASLDRSLLKPASVLQIFFEDVSLFFVNFFLWPIHGHLILSQQILLILMLPIALPFLIMEALVKGMLAINNSLRGAHLTEYHISLLDLENIIRT